MKLFRESDLERIINYFGIRNQKIKVIEELAELQKEICKNLEHQYDDKALEEELADAQLMINQLMIMCDITKSDIEYQMNLKIKRTMDIIDALEKK